MSTKTKTYYEELGRKLSIHFPDIEKAIALDPGMKHQPLISDIGMMPLTFEYFLHHWGVSTLNEIEDMTELQAFKITVIFTIIKAYDPEVLITTKIIKRGIRKAVATLFQDHPSTVSQLINRWRSYPELRYQYKDRINTYAHALSRDLPELRKRFINLHN